LCRVVGWRGRVLQWGGWFLDRLDRGSRVVRVGRIFDKGVWPSVKMFLPANIRTRRLNESMGGKRLSNHILKCNGIDRIDSKKGYTKENSASCCKYCNIAKHTMMEDEFFKWVKRVYEYNF
jgi:hypothetical protein